MAKSKVSPAAAPAADAPVSKGIATRFSQWLIRVGTKALRELDERSQVSVDLVNRGVVLGKLDLRKDGRVIVASAFFNEGGEILFSGLKRNHNFREFRQAGAVSLVDQAQTPELSRAVRRWNDIERYSSEGLV
jgi:hypothetical protein